MSDVPKNIKDLSKKEKALLAHRLIEEKRKASGLQVSQLKITPLKRDTDTFPLSFSQQRLWFIDQLIPDSAFYNIPLSIQLTGVLNKTALEKAINEIIRRHETLRTTFKTIEAQPVQVIHPAFTMDLPMVDIGSLTQLQQESKTRELSRYELMKPFNLSTGPLLRARLLAMDKERHILLVTMHHILSDVWSLEVFMRELAILYDDFFTGRSPSLPDIKVQYVDFAHWQRETLKGEVLAEELSYWKGRLSNIPVLELPTDRPRPAVQTYNGACHNFTLTKELSVSLQELSNKEGVTLFMTLLAAFQALLYRYTGQDDIAVGVPNANRNTVEAEGLIGFFVNMFVMRTDLSARPNFLELLRQVREVALGAYAHQKLPFEKLVEELQLERNLSHTPLFQVTFQLLNILERSIKLPNMTLSLMESSKETVRFDIELNMWEEPEAVTGYFVYNQDLFDEPTIARMARHLQKLLESVVKAPEKQITEIEILTATEKQEIFGQWNKTGTNYSVRCINRLFEAQVEKTPEAVALVFEDVKLSYRELNRRANRLAHRLISLGVRPDVLVGMCMEPSLDMVVGILAILKAGGAYVPMDPNYPKERLTFMLDDTGTPLLLTQKHLAQRIPEYKGDILFIDSEDITGESEENPTSGVSTENLIYVIYTSGSTGKPKGVTISHYNVARLLEATNSWFNFNGDDVWTLFHSYVFDFTVWELWGSLLYGGRLVVVPYLVRRSPETFYDLLIREGVTVLNQTPSAFRQLARVDEIKTGQLNLRLVIFGGEALSMQSLASWFERHGDKKPQLINMYGITETTVHVTYYPVKADDLSRGSVIGVPIPDLQAYILDKNMQAVPIGVPGELCIGGAGLARGYLNRPDLSAVHFVPNPFSEKPGERLYRSGDLGRYLADGNIEYMGRIDHQVKIRGFRVELGEIESVLLQHPEIREALVLVREENTGEKRLAAYFVPKEKHRPSYSDLRNFLKDKLPEYMVPSAFVLLESMPLTSNGKVDRRALPSPDQSRPELGQTFAAPQSDAEKILANIWADVLGIEKVGIHDNFFELGGDSILSIHAIARARQEGLQLTVQQLFQHQSIAELAAVAGSIPSSAIKSEQGLVTGTAPLTPIQKWFFEQNLPEPNHFNLSLLLEVSAQASAERLQQILDYLPEHHDALRLRFVKEGLVWKQSHTGLEKTHFSVIDLSRLSMNEQRSSIERISSELQAGLNIKEGPLVHSVLFDLCAGKSNRLLIVVHHLVVDGVSWGILLGDIERAYKQLNQGESIDLGPKTTSFKYWAQRLEEYSRSEGVTAELNYWVAELNKLIAPLPMDDPGGRDNNIEASSATLTKSLETDQTRILLQEVPQAYNTQINDILLTALTQTFAEWTGHSSILIDLEGHGREALFEDIDISRTVGWFTTIFPVRLELGEKGSPVSALKAIKEQLRRIPNKGIGYGILRYLSLDEAIRMRLEALPQAEVCFNYLGQLGHGGELVLGPARESIGPAHSPLGHRRYLLEINCSIIGNRLQMQWTYSKNIHRRETVEHLAHVFCEALQSIIAHCRLPEAKGYTPSDFPSVALSQEELDKLAEKFDGFDEE